MTQEQHRALMVLAQYPGVTAYALGRAVKGDTVSVRSASARGRAVASELIEHGLANKEYDSHSDSYNYVITAKGRSRL